MKKILIAYDGSTCAEAAIADLSQAGLPQDLHVTLLTVADVWLPASTTPAALAAEAGLPPSLRAARERALHSYQAAEALAVARGQRLHAAMPHWRIEAEACADSPGWAVVKKAHDIKADLIVVGSHGRNLLERVFMGSVSHRVLTDAECSVRVVRPAQTQVPGRLRMLVALDGSASAAAVMAAVVARNWPKHTEIKVVTVIDPRMESLLGWSDDFVREWYAEHDQGVREGVCRMVEHFAKQIEAAGFKADTGIFEGDPKHEILKAAKTWEADAIILGAQGLHYGGRRTLGTTADHVVTHAPCTVEVVRTV